MTDPRSFLESLFLAAVEAAKPEVCLPNQLQLIEPPTGRTVVVGAGKASAAMAASCEKHWPGSLEGTVVTRYGHAVRCDRIEVLEASHPLPDDRSVAASRRILDRVSELTDEDLVLCLLSGGGSSLLALPAEGVGLSEKIGVTQQLLRSGASIHEINTVRKHLSRIKGGRLAAACFPARVETFVISDVPGDDLSFVASGPTLPDPTTSSDAQEILGRYEIPVPNAIQAHFASPDSESPKPGDSKLARSRVHLIASASMSLAAAAELAKREVRTHLLSDRVGGEAEEAARAHGAIALLTAEQADEPTLLLSGGETTVRVRGNGRGGRNVQFIAALARELKGAVGIFAFAADTDGVDGTDDIAGAYIDPSTYSRAGERLDGAISSNDAHTLFQSLGDEVRTGPTLTNVNDFRAILVMPKHQRYGPR